MKNKKILIVTHQFLPFVSPRTTRWSYLIDELIGKGNEVTVLSGTNPENIKKNYDVIYFGNKKFSSKLCTNKARKRFNLLFRNYRGNGHFIPLLPNNRLDKVSVNKGIVLIKDKINWIEGVRLRLEKEKSHIDRRMSLEKVNKLLITLVKNKEEYFFIKGSDKRYK